MLQAPDTVGAPISGPRPSVELPSLLWPCPCPCPTPTPREEVPCDPGHMGDSGRIRSPSNLRSHCRKELSSEKECSSLSSSLRARALNVSLDHHFHLHALHIHRSGKPCHTKFRICRLTVRTDLGLKHTHSPF